MAADDPAGEVALGSRPWVGRELLFALELAGLAAFAFSRPVLDSFGRSPETFIALQATGSEILLFGLGVAVLPVLVAVAVGFVGGLAARRFRWAVQVAMVGALAGIGAWRMGVDQTGWTGTATKLLLLGVVVAALAGFLRWWERSRDVAATFLRYGAVAVVVFGAQFLLASEASELAFGSGPVVNVEIAQQVSDDLGDDPPSVLYVVFDALPTMSLLDGEGNVDAETFPNFGALVDDSTWYRNHTTVSAFTNKAVPAMLTGRYPEPDEEGVNQDPESLFTLLGGSYNLQVMEQVTRLCPTEVCPVERSPGVMRLWQDAVDWWLGGTGDQEERQFDMAGALGDDRYEVAEQWIADLRLGVTSRPDLTFFHVVLPHEQWQFTSDGTPYRYPEERPTGTAMGLLWSQSGIDVGEQRHMVMLQGADRLLGQLVDKLEEAGVYDDTLIVVTADHGAAFTAGAPQRAISEENQEWIAWVPLIVKEPGQTDPRVDDENVELVDIVPTITDLLGVELPWDVDGIPASRAADREAPYRKLFSPTGWDLLEPAPGSRMAEIDWRDHFDDVVGYRPPTASGPDGVWRLTEYGHLVDTDVAELAEGAPAGELVVQWPSSHDGLDPDDLLPLEVVAGTDAGADAVVAFALNGTIGALGEVQPAEQPPGRLVHGLLAPWLFREGDNELTAYVVEGPVGDEVLHPLDVSY